MLKVQTRRKGTDVNLYPNHYDYTSVASKWLLRHKSKEELAITGSKNEPYCSGRNARKRQDRSLDIRKRAVNRRLPNPCPIPHVVQL